ncbi:MAG: hypothetical protein MJ238_04630 [Bacilli bacterium]|nr:hypothetical protein [Bacilli bacterium]
MIIELINKERVEKRAGEPQSAWSFALGIVLRIALYVGIIVLEVFLFSRLHGKLEKYAFGSAFSFLILILFAIMLVESLFAGWKAKTILFDKNDRFILGTLPVSSSDLIASKVSFIYLQEFFSIFLLSVPLLFTYAVLEGYSPRFYIFSIFYPMVISLFGVGISLVSSVVFEVFGRIVKKNDILQFAIACIGATALCLVYQFVLTLFLEALAGSTTSGILSVELVQSISRMSKCFGPVYFYCTMLVDKTNIFPFTCLTLGFVLLSLLIGLVTASLAYNRFASGEVERATKVKKTVKTIKVQSGIKYLLKKEFDLIFKDSTYIFSYTALLIMAPFFSFIVISSLNSIVYANIRILVTYFPDIISGLNMLMILLFSSAINASASLSISREGKSIQIVKFIPIKPEKQIIAKATIPTILSSISFIVSIVALLITSNINLTTSVITLISGEAIIVFTNFVGIIFDMNDQRRDSKKLGWINTLLAFVAPVLMFVIHFVFAMIGVSVWYSYLVELVLSIALISPIFFNVGKQYNRYFEMMEIG